MKTLSTLSDAARSTSSRSVADWAGASWSRRALVVILGSAVLAASAWAEIPMWPVPVTLQSLALVLIATAYGRTLAVATTAAYLAEGALGLPVFAGGAGGAHVLLGPTGGYLLGFLAAAALVGALADREKKVESASWIRRSVAMMLAHGLILALGASWLSLYVGPRAAIATGVAPFVLGSVLKVGAAVLALSLSELRFERR